MTSSPPSAQDGVNPELESFRQQWISDLRTRTDQEHPPQQQQPHDGRHGTLRSTSSVPATHAPMRNPPPPVKSKISFDDVDDGFIRTLAFDGHPTGPTVSGGGSSRHNEQPQKKLVSALDHYEEAMDKESQGNMGDSLKLYRQAYRLDSGVDRRYREKHFPHLQAKAPPSKPAASPQVTSPTSTATASTVPSASHKHSVEASAKASATAAAASTAPSTEEPAKLLSIGELIDSFAGLQIVPTEAEVEGAPPPPCPLASLPSETLVHILRDVAVDDVGDFARLSRVCKRFAFLVATEQRIWRRVALGPEVGFAAMLYRFQRGIEWGELAEEEQEPSHLVDADGSIIGPDEVARRRLAAQTALTESLTPSVYPSWRALFRNRPRIRFNGCYICTVNYVRTGQASTNQSTWGQPIHIVTYYRYLRFFRDGTLISLLTTNEPADVVHHLTRSDLRLHHTATQPHLPSAVMALALRGRWRLSSATDLDLDESSNGSSNLAAGPAAVSPTPVSDRPASGPGAAPGTASTSNRTDINSVLGAPSSLQPADLCDAEGNVYVETEGAAGRYLYRMELTLRSAGKATRNNKLAWRGFYSYNKLTDDWAEFGLKNDKPFYFSRVKSYGNGE